MKIILKICTFLNDHVLNDVPIKKKLDFLNITNILGWTNGGSIIFFKFKLMRVN